MNENPLATAEQTALELEALGLLEYPRVQQARAEAAARWREVVGTVPPEIEAHFASALEQAAFTGVLASSNLDARRPRVHSTSHWAHTVADRSIPATMTVFPNPDAAYRFMPVEADSGYVLCGRFGRARPLINEFSVLTRELETVANLSGPDLVVEADGTFSITLDSRPAGGRRNHLQLTGEAAQVLVRDLLADWAAERPSALILSRMDGPPARPSLSGEALEAQAARSLHEHVSGLIAMTRLVLAGRANTLTRPVIPRPRGEASVAGALVTQAGSWGNFRLEPSEALVLTLHFGGAAYASVALSDLWSVTDDVTCRTSSFNHTQAIQDVDGSYTFVLAATDPGVHNWLDTGGLDAGAVFARWAGFEPVRLAEANPSISTRLVKRSELPQFLPPETRRLDAAGRREQIAKRARDFAWRGKIGDYVPGVSMSSTA